MLALVELPRFSADAEMIRRWPIQQYHCSSLPHSAVLICPDWQRTFILEEIHATP
jgi:hypothetical protein